MRLWATYLKEVALDAIRTKGMCQATAVKIQDALIVCLVVGADIPPIRVRVIKTLCHPKHNVLKCQDKDCLLAGCLGDRLELLHEDEEDPSSCVKGAKLHVIHGKNDRRDKDSSFSLEFPEGVFRDLLLAHVLQGRDLIERKSQRETNNQTSLRLFVSHMGNSFSDSTFTQHWVSMMKSAKSFGVPYASPTDLRTVLIEDCTYSMPREGWDGVALIMGNCVRQWRASYWPSRKRRLIDHVVAAYTKYVTEADEGHQFEA